MRLMYKLAFAQKRGGTMKQFHSMLLRSAAVAVAVGLFAGSAWAFDLGGKMKDAAKEGAKAGSKSVVEKEINKNLKEKSCSFKPKTTELTCDIDELLGTIKAQKSIAEGSGLANDVDIYVEVGRGKDPKNSSLGSERADVVRNKLRQKISWWDWYDSMTEGDALKIYVKIE